MYIEDSKKNRSKTPKIELNQKIELKREEILNKDKERALSLFKLDEENDQYNMLLTDEYYHNLFVYLVKEEKQY